MSTADSLDAALPRPRRGAFAGALQFVGAPVYSAGDAKEPVDELQLDVTYEPLPGFAAVRIGATLRNAGVTAVRRVRDLHTLHLRFDLASIGDPTVRSINGGTTFCYVPPRALQVSEHTLLGGRIGGRAPFALDSGLRGRSSQGHIPLFLISDGDDRSGCFGGLEWPGD